ncbi:MAG TPA: hypothetical protein VFN41_03140 [Candidatus Limnocylindrales bacterium]|nr:hypothetical protein [Candidatus Limnocylindrales bacterium]
MSERKDDPTTANFLRGLTIGAIIGAIIAGSRLWRVLGRRPKR